MEFGLRSVFPKLMKNTYLTRQVDFVTGDQVLPFGERSK